MELRLPKTTPKQAEIERTPAKRKILVCGRRFGKTTLFAKVACEQFLHGKVILEAAPVAKQTNAFWRKCKVYLKPLIDAGLVYKNESERVLEMGKGRIQTQTAHDADTLRGDYADLLLLDEYSYMDASAWEQVGAPMLLDSDGDAWFAFTPNRRNHAFRLYGKAISEGGDYAAFHATSHDNPHLKQEALERLTRDMTEEQIKQEILAEFLENEGAVFRNIAECTRAPITTPEEHKGHPCCMGVDYGKKEDYTVISVGCAECGCEVFIDRFAQIDYTFQNQRVENAWKRWGVKAGKGDSASIGEAALDYLHKAGVPLVGIPTNSYTQKAALIDALSLAMDSVLVQFLPDPVGVAEFEAYEQTLTKTGLPSYSAPQGMHDDTVIARALMWRAMQSTPKPRPTQRTRQQTDLENWLNQGSRR